MELKESTSAFRWRQERHSMPHTMSSPVQIVAIGGKVYVGGGFNRGKGQVDLMKASGSAWLL